MQFFDDFPENKKKSHQNWLIFTKSSSNGTIIIVGIWKISEKKQLVCGASLNVFPYISLCVQIFILMSIVYKSCLKDAVYEIHLHLIIGL